MPIAVRGQRPSRVTAGCRSHRHLWKDRLRRAHRRRRQRRPRRESLALRSGQVSAARASTLRLVTRTHCDTRSHT